MDKWTDKEEIFLQDLERQCDILYKHYAKEYTYYKFLSSKFNIPILVISAINALTAIALNDFLAQRYVSILNAVLSAGTGVLGSIQLYLKINEKLSNALRSNITFKKLALKISKELSVEREKRPDGQLFLNECFAEFTTAVEAGNPIEKKIMNHMRLDKSEPESGGNSSAASNLRSIASSLLMLGRSPPSPMSEQDEV
jgi:hypothetical protein